jgi:nicotinate-nucleotide adenylyltransferase
LRIAIFGGTFDPVHKAHIAIAEAARDQYHLDRILLIPAAQPPHKQDRQTAPYEDRFRMLELACMGHRALEPSRLEAGEGTSYSIHTIENVRRTISTDDRLFFIIGADAFAEIQTWYRWTEVTHAVEFILVARPGHDCAAPEGAVVHVLEWVQVDVSSSDIRSMLSRGERPAVVPPNVLDYIGKHGLYGYSSRSIAKS